MSGWKAVRDKWESVMEDLNSKLHQKNAITDQLEKIEKKTKIPRLRLVQVLFLVVLVVISFSLGTELISNCVGFLYPAYASIKAIESLSKEDDTRWLTYWVVYGFFVFTESLTDVFLFWFPFYWATKCLFLVWCMLPTPSNGSDFIYNFLIRPFFLRHEKQIDDAINQASSSAKQYIGKVSNTFEENYAMLRQGNQSMRARELNYDPLFNEDHPERTPPPFPSKLDELKNKYGENRIHSPERSISNSRSKLFADSNNSNRSPERSAHSSVDDRPSLRDRGERMNQGMGIDRDPYDRDKGIYTPSSSSPVRSTARQSSRNYANDTGNVGDDMGYSRTRGNNY